MPAQKVQTLSSEQFAPVGYLAVAARTYAEAIGSEEPSINYQYVRLDPSLGQKISDAYQQARSWDERALAAYRAFRDETVRQFRLLVDPVRAGGLGVTIRAVDHDPYADARSMAEDLRQRRLDVYSTNASGNPHPFLHGWENDMFRAVHDAFGHAASGCGFDRDGEEAAWLSHCFMYSALARRALTTETRGQSCAQTFHHKGQRFPSQKLVLLPRKFSDPTLAVFGSWADSG